FDFQNGAGKTSLEIFSPNGQLIFSKNWIAQNHELVPVELEKQPNGLYFWQLRTLTGVASGKLMKE
ncbi:MAG: T9SS type A sorting domain-containing protein, partial [Saprospiraceae bacterium]